MVIITLITIHFLLAFYIEQPSGAAVDGEVVFDALLSVSLVWIPLGIFLILF